MRSCSLCREEKPVEAFGPRRAACRPCEAARQREYRRRDPERYSEYGRRHSRAYALMANYGLTVAAYDARFQSQGCACASCGSTEHGGRNWHVDHDHATGMVRGILCHGCNVSLGLLAESPERIRALATYIEGAP